MIAAQTDKELNVVLAAAGDTTVTSTAWIDTLGWDYCKVLVTLATGASTESTFDALNFTEADTSAASATSAIVALTGTTNTVTSTSAGFCIPVNRTATTHNGSILRFLIDTRARKRFLYLTATAGTTNVYGVTASLSRAEVVPAVTAGAVALNVIA